ncbi:hypothetical protein ACRS5S_09125 [Nocardia asiatica]|uniref:hypothetical protein n=1 Tax=Nocardia asiatica TaxID=209252 RepID=UPI003EE039A4
MLSSCKKYGKTLMELSASLSDDLRNIPDHYFYRQAPPQVFARADSITKQSWNPLKRKMQNHPKRSEIEERARQALNAAISAFNFFDELSDRSYLAEMAHIQAHRCAEVVGHVFGCVAEYRDGEYWDVCALQLMHLRVGFSAGMNTVRCCSICSEEIDLCEHQLDEKYEVVADRSADGTCTICGRNSCDHAVGDSVSSYPGVVHRDIELNEVSMVRFPRDPLARLTGVQMDEEMISEILAGRPPGVSIACHRCIGPCGGFSYPLDGPGILKQDFY